MKRNLFTIMLAFLVVFGVNAQKADFMLKSKKSFYQPKKGKVTNTIRSKGALAEDFEGSFAPIGWSLVTGTGDWEQSADVDHTSGSGNSAIYDCYNTNGTDPAYLVTPKMNVTAGDATFSFWLNYYLISGTWGEAAELYVEVSSDDGTIWTSGTTNLVAGNEGAGWLQQTIDLTAFEGQDYTDMAVIVRFKAISDYGSYNIAIDDVAGPALALPAHDLGVGLVTPTFVLSGETVTPQVTINNLGDNDEATYSVTLTDGGVYSSTISVSTSLGSGSSAVIDMDTWTPADGDYTLTATVTLAGDLVAANDEMVVSCKVADADLFWAHNGTDGMGTFYNLNPGSINYVGGSTGGCFGYAQVGDMIYGVDYNNKLLVSIDPVTGVWTTVGAITPESGHTLTGISYDHVSDKIYLLSTNLSNASSIYTYDIATATTTLVGTNAVAAMFGIGFDAAGNLYGINASDDILGTISTTDGSWTAFGTAAGFNINYVQDLEYDFNNDVMYYAAYNFDVGSGQFYTVDLTSGALTLIGNFDGGANISALAIPYTGKDADIISYSFPDQTGPAVFDNALHTISVEVYHGTDLSSLVASFEASYGASVLVGATTQVSGTTPNDFSSSSVTYSVTSEDLATAHDWVVTVTEAPIGTDASLKDLTIDGTTVTGFDAATFTYNIMYPYGTTAVPVVDGVTTDPNAIKIVTQATNLDGTVAERTATIAVTAEDGTTSQDYTVVFSVNPDLLMTDGTFTACGGVNFYDTGGATGNFQNDEDYTLTINPENVGDLVTVSFTSSDFGGSYDYLEIHDGANATDPLIESSATITNNDFTGLTFTATVANGGSLTFVFHSSGVVPNPGWEATLDCVAPATDATLSALTTTDGTLVPVFDPATYVYTVELLAGTTVVPTVAGTPTDANASVSVVQAQNLTGTAAERTATVTCTAQDGTTVLDYTVEFSVAISINDIASKGISVYPNPSNGTFTVNVENDFNLEVLDITGKVINTQVLNGTNTVNINNAGVYFLRFSNKEGSVTQKVIVQ